MSIIPISNDQFDSFNHARNPLTKMFITEKEWFTDTNRNIIGTITLDRTDDDWGYLVFACDEDQVYRPIDIKTSIESFKEAEKTIISVMSKMELDDQASEILFESSKFTESKQHGSVLVKDINSELKTYLSKHPEKLYDLSPRKFEELIASVLEDLGFEVELTKATRDGGTDIIAYIRNAVCEYLTLVECKKYAPDNKVGVGIVREVTGVHHIKQATKSLIVTTSYFSADAIKEAKAFEHQLELKNYDSIKDWLQKY
jgi:HJR/Mrr/RecB family endonuclease